MIYHFPYGRQKQSIRLSSHSIELWNHQYFLFNDIAHKFYLLAHSFLFHAQISSILNTLLSLWSPLTYYFTHFFLHSSFSAHLLCYQKPSLTLFWVFLRAVGLKNKIGSQFVYQFSSRWSIFGIFLLQTFINKLYCRKGGGKGHFLFSKKSDPQTLNNSNQSRVSIRLLCNFMFFHYWWKEIFHNFLIFLRERLSYY